MAYDITDGGAVIVLSGPHKGKLGYWDDDGWDDEGNLLAYVVFKNGRWAYVDVDELRVIKDEDVNDVALENIYGKYTDDPSSQT